MGTIGDAAAICRFDLRDRVWSSLGSLDNAGLIQATEDQSFGFLSTWQVTPSETGVSNFVDVGGENVDFELILDPGDTAEHGLGVLGQSDPGTYVVTFDRSEIGPDLTVSLVLGGDVLLSQTAVADGAAADRARVSFDLSALDLSSFLPGISAFELRITNDGDAAVRLDNFEVSGATFDTLETVGADQIDPADVALLSGDPSVTVTTADFADRPDLVQAVLDGVSLTVDEVAADSGAFLWAFQAPPFLFDFVPDGEVLTLEIILGSAIIIASSIFILRREHQLREAGRNA